jgi:hypothetical protein
MSDEPLADAELDGVAGGELTTCPLHGGQFTPHRGDSPGLCYGYGYIVTGGSTPTG